MTERTITLKVKGEAELRQVTKQMEELGQSYDKVRVQFEQGARVSDKAGKSADMLRGQFRGLATELGLMYGLGEVVGMIKDFGVASVQAAREAAAAEAQLAAVLKSTGGAAGVTKEQLTAMASQLQDLTMFSDEAVVGGQSLLLTFTNIGKDVFPQATQTILDMSQALGQDLKSSAIQLGKALNDPVQGITALSRVGVSFSESQKQMIRDMMEANNIVGAQKIILAELTKEFGGSAQAAREAAGGYQDTSVAFGEFQEAFGRLMMSLGDAGVFDATTNTLNQMTAGADAWKGVIEESIPALNAYANRTFDAGQQVGKFGAVVDKANQLTEQANASFSREQMFISQVTAAQGRLTVQVNSAAAAYGGATAAADPLIAKQLQLAQTADVAAAAFGGQATAAQRAAQLNLATANLLPAATTAAGAFGGQQDDFSQGRAMDLYQNAQEKRLAYIEEQKAAEEALRRDQERAAQEASQTMTRAFEQSANNIRSTIESVLKPSLDEVWQPPADEARFDESARRLATVATGGFSSEWLNQLTTQFAGQDFFQPLVQAMQAGDEGKLKQAATDILQNQVTKLWDVEMIKSRVRAQLQQDNLKQQLINEIQQELGAEGMAVPIQTTAAAAGELTGEVKAKLEEATGHFDGFKQAITDQKWPEVGKDIVDGVNKGIDDNIMKVKEKLKDLAKEAIKAARQELGAKSPSEAFADVARDIIAGLAQGLDQGQGAYQNALAQLLNLDTRNFDILDMVTKIDNPVEKSLKHLHLSRDKVKFIMREMNKELRKFPDILRSGSAEEIEKILQSAAAWNKAGLKYDRRNPVQTAIESYIKSIMKMRQELPKLQAEADRANFQKMLGGVGQFANLASQEADTLNKKIVVLQSLLRNGGNEFMVEGQKLNRGQAEARLAALIGEQSGMQGNLQNILGANQRLQSYQERQGLLGQLAAPTGAGAGAIIGGLAGLTELLGSQLMRGLAGRNNGNVRSYQIDTLIINSSGTEDSILAELERLNDLIPAGT